MEDVQSAIERATSLQLRIRDCKSILQHAEGFTNKRWMDEDGRHFFRDLEQDFPEKPHMVNTSTAMAILCRYPQVFRPGNVSAFKGLDDLCKFYQTNYTRPDDKRAYWPSKGTNQWSPYVSSLVLTAIAECALARGQRNLESFLEDKDFKNLKEAVSFQVGQVRDYMKEWAAHNLPKEDADYDHAFFAYTAWTALATMDKAKYPVFHGVPRKDFEESLVTRFKLEFYSQMTFRLADIPQHLDATTLILSVYCLANLVGDREYLPGDVLDAALDTIFSLQQASGFWPTSTPLLGAASGRVGCSSIELANCLLKTDRLTLRFDQYQQKFDRLFSQLQKEFNILDPERGWAVDIRRNGNARQTWYGFMVYEFMYLYAKKMSEIAAALIVRGFRFTRDTPKITWDKLADYEGFKLQIDAAIINPREKNTGSSPKCSLIFFGPPGTGKTTIAAALANRLGWGMIEIGPGDFLTKGIEGIFAQGDTIFQRLLMLSQVVVLFDEIDELVEVRDRDAEKISRFLTTYMLPWIQRLRDKATIVFIFATNRIEIFDPAIRRLGRFDLVLPLGSPQGTERAKVMNAMNLGMTDAALRSLADSLPPQATIGEIQDAVERARHSGNPLTEKAVLERLKTTTTDDEWKKFLLDTKIHGSVRAGD
jgi:hypothetical protein